MLNNTRYKLTIAYIINMNDRVVIKYFIRKNMMFVIELYVISSYFYFCYCMFDFLIFITIKRIIFRRSYLL